jgi:hypothetical protein
MDESALNSSDVIARTEKSKASSVVRILGKV